MTRRSISRPARERTDVGLSGIPPGLARFPETGSVVTAAAVVLGIVQANEAYARSFSDKAADLRLLPSALPAAEGQSPLSSRPEEPGVISYGDAARHEEAADPAHQAGVVPEPALSRDVTTLDETAAVSHQSPADMDHDLVRYVAEKMTAGLSNLVDTAIEGTAGPVQLHDLARDVVGMAAGVVEEVRAQLNAGNISGAVRDLLSNGTPSAAGLVDAVHDTVASTGVIDLLHGDLAGSAAAVAPLGGIVASLAGEAMDLPASLPVAGAITNGLPELVQHGGTTGGMLADIFYDDGQASQDMSGGSHLAAPITDPIDIGFAGQPLGGTGELTGMTQTGNALHLI